MHDAPNRRMSLTPALLPSTRCYFAAALVMALALPAGRPVASQAPGPSPFALQHIATLGTTGTPWLRSNATLNQPWGLGADRDGVWVANALGRNLVRFGTGPVEELGRAGDLLALWGQPVRYLADVDVALPARPRGQPPRPTPTPDPDGGVPLSPRRVIWFADAGAHVVAGLQLAPDGTFNRTYAIGQPDVPGTDDDHFRGPTGIVASAWGDLFVSDTGNHRVQVLDSERKVVATIGQTGVAGTGPDQLNHPARLAWRDDRLYVADTGNHRVQAFDVKDPLKPRLVRTYGETGVRGSGEGQFDEPLGVAVDATFLHVADSGNARVQVLALTDGKHFATLDGEQLLGCGTGRKEDRWEFVSDVALDQTGRIYVARPRFMTVASCDPFDRTIRRGFGAGERPYVAQDELLYTPAGVAVAANGMVVISEIEGHRVLGRPPGPLPPWGTGTAGIAGNGSAHFDQPMDVAALADGRFVVADRGNGRLVVMDGDGQRLAELGTGTLGAPDGLAALPDGRLAVADAGIGRVMILDLAGGAPATPPGEAGGPFGDPADVALAPDGSWYVSDRGAHTVQAYDPAGQPTFTVGQAGTAGDDFSHLNQPDGLAVDADGRLYIADTGNHRLQVFDAAGTYLTTVGGVRGPGTGGFFEPRGVAVGTDGRVYVADTYGHRVQVFAPAAGSWTPAAVNGFSQRSTMGVMALEAFDGDLFAGTRGLGGGRVLKRTADGAWTDAAPPGFGAAGNSAVRALGTFGARLYAGVENFTVTRDPVARQNPRTSLGAELWRSADGGTWERVIQGGSGRPNNSGVQSFTEFQGKLYAGTRTLDTRAGPPELWRSASGNAGDWQRVRLDLFDRDGWRRVSAISALATYSGTLVAGTCNWPRPQLWASGDGDRWYPIGHREPGEDPVDADPELGSGSSHCVTSFATFDGRLYVGLGTDSIEVDGYQWYGGQAEVWRCATCDGTDWEPATAPGLGQDGNRGQLALQVADEPPFQFLYLAVGNVQNGLEVWRALDGLDWEPVAEGGFGDDDNVDVPGNAMAGFAGRLYIGSTNLAHGGELWSSAGSRPAVVPTPAVPGPTSTPRPSPQPPTGRAQYEKVAEWPTGGVAPADVLDSPLDMDVGDDGSIYILDGQPGRVAVLRPDGRWGLPFGERGSGPDRVTQPGAIGVDSAHDRVYVSDLGTERLVVFDLAGQYVRSIPEIYAVDVAVRPDGTLWVADHLAGAARLLAPDGIEVERFGSFGPGDEDQSLALTSVVEEPGGRLWVGDRYGRRLRVYERDGGGVFRRVRTLDFLRRPFGGCTAERLQVLADNVVLAGTCVLAEGRLQRKLTGNFRGNDLCGMRLWAANPGAGHFVALSQHDPDPNCQGEIDVYPVVVRFADEGFDIVTGIWRGRGLSVVTADPNAVAVPERLTAQPDGTLVLSDYFGLRRFSPEGRVLENLPVESYPSRSASLVVDPQLVVATGTRGEVAGVAQYTYGRAGDAQVVVHGQGIERRYCRARRCAQGLYLSTLWDTTLSSALTEHNTAAAFEPTRGQYVLLQLWRDNPSGLAFPARLFLYPLVDRGRKTEVLLSGSDREALWTDVDAGPDGHIYVLDTLNDAVLVLDAHGTRLAQLPTPKDAWKVAGGPNGEVFLLTNYGHVVRLAGDGTVLSRFVGLPNDLAPATALADLAVDAWGRVYVIDTLYNQVTVFEPRGTEADVLEGNRCGLAGDKWVAPRDVLLGGETELTLALNGTCGYLEEPADIVLAVSGVPEAEVRNLQVARQIAALVDLDRHRLGVLSFAVTSNIEARLTQNRDALIQALASIGAGRPVQGCEVNNLAALKAAGDVFDGTPGRRQVLVLVNPGREPPPGECSWDHDKIAAEAMLLRARGIQVVAVNAEDPPSIAATSEILGRVSVAPRGTGTGRPAIRRAVTRRWPDVLIRTGTLTDTLPANIDYVPASANPPARWDAASRTLTWDLADLALGASHRFTLRIRPMAEGLWPTNVEASAAVTDGWGQPATIVLPIPQVRVFGALPPTPTATATRAPTPGPSPTPRPTPIPVPIYLPVLLRTEPCQPESRHADTILVLDTSGSMSDTTSPGGPTKLDAARDAARAFLAQLQPERDQAALVQFNTAAQVLVPLTGDIPRVSTGLTQLTQASGTRIDLALDAAATELAGPARRPGNNAVIILLTDGDPTGATPDDVRQAAARAKVAGALVFTIGLGQGLDDALLADVASRPEWYYPAPDTSELAAIYQRIAYEIPCKPLWP